MRAFVLPACRRSRWGPAIALVAALCLFGTAPKPSAAHSIIPTLVSVTPLGGGVYQWTYDLTLDTTSKVQLGDFFEQADLTYMIPGSASASNASFTVFELPSPVPVINPSSSTPPTVTPGFNPTAPAVELLWNDGTVLGTPGTQGNLGTYSFNSKSDILHAMLGGYGSNDHNIATGLAQGNLGATLVPGQVPVSGAHTAIIGLFGSTMFWFRMRRKSA